MNSDSSGRDADDWLQITATDSGYTAVGVFWVPVIGEIEAHLEVAGDEAFFVEPRTNCYGVGDRLSTALAGLADAILDYHRFLRGKGPSKLSVELQGHLAFLDELALARSGVSGTSIETSGVSSVDQRATASLNGPGTASAFATGLQAPRRGSPNLAAMTRGLLTSWPKPS